MQAIAGPHGGTRSLRLSCALAVLSGSLAGCTELRISDSELQRISTALGTSLSQTACQAPPTPAPNDKTIDIVFEEKSPGVWCPVRAVETCPQVYQTAKVQWRSVRLNGDGIWEPFSTRFKVYLTPFQGDAFPAENGKTGYKTLNSNAPPGVYKYTVWDSPTGSADPECDPLDPNFFVNT